jgi:hypothetical protein
MKDTMSAASPLRTLPSIGTRVFVGAFVCASLTLLSCDGTSGSGAKTATEPAHDSTAPESASPLLIEPAELDMGDLLPNTPVEKTVRLTNTGATPLLIRKALADCGCTTPTWPSEPIAPGASVDTVITMDAGNQQAVELVKRVTFDIEDADPAFLTVKGRVGSFLSFEPATIEGAKDDDAQPPVATITVRSMDQTPFTIIALDPPIAESLATTPALEQQVKIDWTRWREEGKPVRVVIETDHPIGPPLGILIRRSLRGNPNAPKVDTPKQQ